MSETNGSPVTRAELAAHVKGIDERFKTVGEDITEMKDNFKSEVGEIKALIEGIYQTFRAERKDRKAKWRAWGPPLLAVVVSLCVSVPVALIHHH